MPVELVRYNTNVQGSSWYTYPPPFSWTTTSFLSDHICYTLYFSLYSCEIYNLKCGKVVVVVIMGLHNVCRAGSIDGFDV